MGKEELEMHLFMNFEDKLIMILEYKKLLTEVIQFCGVESIEYLGSEAGDVYFAVVYLDNPHEFYMIDDKNDVFKCLEGDLQYVTRL
ncbi:MULTISPECIES: hypothetical protein [Bacillus cereus group]|uniref:hypothetical protein n=1 Tax=Bacillus cereus group TaxID=86661 RepID=UPI001C737570|nr:MULTISPECIES: hypothetical protein [Bacillus cereus group]MBX0351809.1 hypothetical protein [Bacillus toyonensis]MDA2716780.1 hypothetical protein [Bacillus cereus group sp. Bc025]